MREAEFKAWLEAGGASTEAGRNTRTHAVKTIEKNLPALGSPHVDLEAAWKADRFEHLRQRLKELREDFFVGGTDFRILMPQSSKPEHRLASWRSWLGQYGQFLTGEPRGDRDADRIRRYVLETYIEPAREREADTVDVLVREVNKALGLNQAWPNICQALTRPRFLEMADVAPPERIGANQSSATVFRFRLSGSVDEAAGPSRPCLLFDAAGAAFKPALNFNRSTGRSAYRVKPAGASNRADDAIEVETVAEVARAMLVEGRPARVQSVHGGSVNYIGYGKQKLVRYELDPAIARQIGVPPSGSVDEIARNVAISSTSPQQELREMPNPTNLILYGPPGTGKTWRTASEAVRLCDGSVSEDREAVRKRYDQLVDAGQVRLVTFHQSYSYEDFVEGLRPVTDSGPTDEGSAQGAGFRLDPKRGIFREICAVAEEARKNAGRGGGFDLTGRRIFKMSLGRAGLEDHIFEAAIAGNYVVLGYGGEVDWSDPRYAEWSAIMERWREEKPEATGNDPNVVQMWPFRTMKEGDIVIVSEGNSHFRAIGEVTGPYRFDPTDVRDYNHKRPVRWLLTPEEPLPVETIYGKNFMMQSCYQLKDALLKKEALARILPGSEARGDGLPDQFVLIIDEINRANISKVFGELITLIEPDKRLGAGTEALAVQLPYSGDTFGVPANLHIVGTMNTADRSIALLDTALRRRFVFREIAPEPELLPADVEGVPLRRVLEVINDRIEYLVDRDHRIGHAFFMRENGDNRAAIDRTMRDKVIPLLQEYFFEDWGRVAAVLGQPRETGGGFLDCRKLKDPTGQIGDDRPSWSVRSVFADDAYDRLIAKAAPAALAEDFE